MNLRWDALQVVINSSSMCSGLSDLLSGLLLQFWYNTVWLSSKGRQILTRSSFITPVDYLRQSEDLSTNFSRVYFCPVRILNSLPYNPAHFHLCKYRLKILIFWDVTASFCILLSAVMNTSTPVLIFTRSITTKPIFLDEASNEWKSITTAPWTRSYELHLIIHLTIERKCNQALQHAS